MVSASVDKLGPLALGIVSLAVIVGVGSIVLAEFGPAAYLDADVTGESSQPATPFPTNITVDKTSNPDFEGIDESSETLVFEDSSAGTNTTLTRGTDYVAYYDEGKFEVQDTSATTDFDETSDFIYSDYTYEYSGQPNTVLNTGINALGTFSDFFTVIVVIGVAAVLFILLGAVRGAGRSVTA